MKKILAMLLSAAMMVVLLAGCGGGDATTAGGDATTAGTEATTTGATTTGATTAATTAGGDSEDFNETGTLLISLPEPTGERFNSFWNDYGAVLRCMLYTRLLILSPDGNDVINDIASSHSVSDDGLTYEFVIRDDVVWHDGTPFTVEDVAWSIATVQKVALATSLFTDPFGYIEGADAWKDGSADTLSGVTTSGNTITIKMSQPNNMMLNSIANFPVLPKHLLEDVPMETFHQSEFWDKPIGTGPYYVKEFIPNEYAILERFEDFYGDKPLIKTVHAGNIGEGDYITKAQANELDYFMTRSLEIVDEVLKNPNYEANEVSILYFRYFTANLMGYNGATDGDVLLKDIRARNAICYAIDRESIVNDMFPGQGEVMNSFVPQSMPQYNSNINSFPYEPETAKSLLDEAGFDFSKTLRMCYYYNDQQTFDLMDTIAYYLSEVGINVDHFLIQGDTTSAIYEKREYDLNYGGYAPGTFYETYAIFNGNNTTYGDRIRPLGPNDFDPLLNTLMTDPDPNVQTETLKKLQEVEQQYMWQIPLFTLKNYVLVNTDRLVRPGEFGHEWTNYDRSFAQWQLLK